MGNVVFTHADDGYGNLVSIANPFGFKTTVYTRCDGKLARFECGTSDHEAAILAVRKDLGDVCLSKSGRWKSGVPVLAIVPPTRCNQ